MCAGWVQQAKIKNIWAEYCCCSDMGHNEDRRNGPQGAYCWKMKIKTFSYVDHCCYDAILVDLVQWGTRLLSSHKYLIFLLLTQEHLKTHTDVGITLE